VRLPLGADPSPLWEELARDGQRIVLLVIDGLGGLPDSRRRRSELQAAHIPNLDALAAESSCGLLEPVAPGVTPGSGPGHLAIFGYHPLRYRIGRGILAALGSGFDLEEGDVAARANFARVDDEGRVDDRRAGRLATRQARTLCRQIREGVELPDGIEWFLEPVTEHRAVLVLRGPDLAADVDDTDPQRTGVAPRPVVTRCEEAQRTAAVVESFLAQAREALAGEEPANALLLRGFGRHRRLPSLEERFALRGLCLAEYPMYRGLCRLLGLEVAPSPGNAARLFGKEFPETWNADRDLWFLHYKSADSRGEDGNFDGKVEALEELDRLLPPLLEREPPVLVVTGDHSTPASMGSHSWHPVPILIRAPTARVDGTASFDELACGRGALGLRPALDVMGLALAHAGRLRKFGA